MANVNVFTSASSFQFTGSIYRVCTNGAAGDVLSASFGFDSTGAPNSPTGGIQFALGGAVATEPICVEADMSSVSCSANLHVWYKEPEKYASHKTSAASGSGFGPFYN